MSAATLCRYITVMDRTSVDQIRLQKYTQNIPSDNEITISFITPREPETVIVEHIIQSRWYPLPKTAMPLALSTLVGIPMPCSKCQLGSRHQGCV